MAYLPNFKNDLFISYRRVSNETRDKWVDVFCKQLSASLEELVGKDVKIWQDTDQLRTGEAWRNEVAAALDNAAIFLAIIARTYFDSDECRRELDRFLKRLKESAGDGERLIMPIFKQPPKAEQLPPDISKFQHHEFYVWDPPGTDRFLEFPPDRADADGQKFKDAIARVAQDVMFALEKLEGRARRRALGKVFMASVSPELQLEREQLRSDLRQRGYLVVPERVYIWSSDDIRNEIARDLEGAQLCVHLAARTPSSDLESSERAKEQLELAFEAMKRKGGAIPLVWIKPASDTHPSARGLLDYIKNDLANEGVEYLQGGLEEFKTEIFKKLPTVVDITERHQENFKTQTYSFLSSSASFAGGPSPVREIALLVEESDACELGPIRTLLADGLKLQPTPLKFAGASPKDPARLAHTLARCDRCLIFWGKQPEEWVFDVIAIEALAGRRGKDKMFVYAAGPETPEKRDFKTPHARVILAADGLNEPAILDFFGDRPRTA
jgi:hypothetical protein